MHFKSRVRGGAPGTTLKACDTITIFSHDVTTKMSCYSPFGELREPSRGNI